MVHPSDPVPGFPPATELETVPVLKALNRASRALATLRGQAGSIPNEGILIDTLALQEAKVSSEIENIVTTQDELFQADLLHARLPDTPILYLSRHITRNKAQYYQRLQAVRVTGHWQEWVIFMLNAVAETSAVTLELVDGIREQMAAVKHRMRAERPKLYSQDLLNNLFRHPYTRIEYVQNDLNTGRKTASAYLEQLTTHGFVQKHRIGKSNYYINLNLVRLFVEVSGDG